MMMVSLSKSSARTVNSVSCMFNYNILIKVYLGAGIGRGRLEGKIYFHGTLFYGPRLSNESFIYKINTQKTT